ncbi:MAG: hypothetical protein SOZ40_01560 [Ezakiella sp.]|nr:hypothetical protein [Ezakiella sp.]MDD7761859.1 hypothetical protein [Bacillota bacterium]MDY3946674.1 hypothetical protein [Ezakiella sp.]
MDYDKEIMELKNKLDEAEKLRAMSLARLEVLENQRDDLIRQIEESGSTTDSIDEDINKLEIEIKKLLEECFSLMPKVK